MRLKMRGVFSTEDVAAKPTRSAVKGYEKGGRDVYAASPYERSCPVPGHQLDFNDLKVIEVSRLVNAIIHIDPIYLCNLTLITLITRI